MKTHRRDVKQTLKTDTIQSIILNIQFSVTFILLHSELNNTQVAYKSEVLIHSFTFFVAFIYLDRCCNYKYCNIPIYLCPPLTIWLNRFLLLKLFYKHTSTRYLLYLLYRYHFVNATYQVTKDT